MPILRAKTTLIAALLAVSLLAAASLIRTGQAHAGPNQASIMVDDDQLVNGNDARRDKALAQMKALGVDYVRVTVLWSVVANGARGRHFNASNPASYPHRNWDRYDNLVRSAARFGISVYFNLTGPGPSWAMGRAPRSQRRLQRSWMPNASEFYKFVAAVGKRFSGSYRKEDKDRGILPRVRFWSLWNEPNQAAWLSPQSYYSPIARRMIPFSPILYRQLYFMGHKALVATGHGRDAILIGETSPLGRGAPAPRDPIAPKAFIRELLCVNAQSVPYAGIDAAARDCASFTRNGPFVASAWAHHPYTLKVAPTVAPKGPDDLTIANIGDLPRLLDSLAVKTGHISAGLGVVLSEFGYETNPPDPFAGVPLAKQSEYMNVGDYLAFLDPRVYAMTQFQLRDAQPDRHHRRGTKAYWDTYQAGLLFANGHQKPSYDAYRLPLVLFKSSGSIGFEGQLRFRPHTTNGDTLANPDSVALEFLPAHATKWQPLAGPIAVTNGRDFFTGTIASPGPGLIRATWKAHTRPYVVHSRSVAVPLV